MNSTSEFSDLENNKNEKCKKSHLINFISKTKILPLELFLKKTEFCRHDFGCLEGIISGTINSFVLSYLLNSCLNFLSLFVLKRQLKLFLLSLVQPEHWRLCGFLTSHTFLLKSVMCFLRTVRNKNDQINNFLAGAIAGFFSIGFLEKSSKMTWSGYLFARSLDSIYRHLVNKKVFKKREFHYLVLFSLVYSFYGYAIAKETNIMPPSIRTSLVGAYAKTYAKNRYTTNIVCEELLENALEKKYGKII